MPDLNTQDAPKTYTTSLRWGDLNSQEWKILGQYFMPSDPNATACWVYFPPDANDSEVARQRATGHLTTVLMRIDGMLCLLAKRPRQRRRSASMEGAPDGFRSSASWF